MRRAELAAAAVSGKPIAAVARETKVSRSWASREANTPETKLLIAGLLDRHVGRIEKLVDKALTVIEDGLSATEFPAAALAAGLKLDPKLWPPDHRVRLIAAKRLMEICLAGRHSDAPQVQQTITWEQFTTIYQGKQNA